MKHKTPKKFLQLKQRLQDIGNLNATGAVLGWDQATYMPPGGAAARGQQVALLSRLAHERLTDPAMGRLLAALQKYCESLPYDSDDAALLRATRREYDRATKVPAVFVAELNAHLAQTYTVWTQARPANDFARVLPLLEKTLDYSRRLANYFPGYDHLADPLIDFSDYGMKTATVRALFAQLRTELVPLAQRLTAHPPADDACLKQAYPEDQQLAFGMDIITRFGYDLQRGRQDKTHHPFATRLAHGDVRITTRVKEKDLSEALFSTLHEAGHAMYEQGVHPALDGLPTGHGASSGVHESQSRLWENIVGRSRGFWEYFYPRLQAAFPAQLRAVPLDTFYRAINKVEPSLIRTDADEVTYNLHVMLRFDFEIDLLEGQLALKDLPEAWHARFQQDFGRRAPDDRDGVLQDVHWHGGLIGGAFQGYTLGNILSAQFYTAALHDHPEIPDHIKHGEFSTLHGWLRDRLYQHGAKFTAPELIERVTGSPLTIAPYLAYLRNKYSELYAD
jgi:carboxypeptidase Taq